MAPLRERLKELREKAGFTQADLAKACGMPMGTIRNYEQGIREPSWRSLFKIATALGTDCRAFAECITDSGPAKVKRPRGRSRKEK